MSQIEKWQKQSDDVAPHYGGYSDVRLWPCYMVYAGLILLASPVLGLFTAALIVSVPAFIAVLKVSQIQNRNPEASAAEWQKIHDLYDAIEQRDLLASQLAQMPAEPKIAKQTKRAPRSIVPLHQTVVVRS